VSHKAADLNPPLRVSKCVVDYASRCPRARAFGNTPTGESDESFPEDVAVLDPSHPLFGRRFKVIRLTRVGSAEQAFEVEYLGHVCLHVPVAATEPSFAGENHPKLSVEALFDLISMAELLEDGVDRSPRSLGDFAAGRATPGHPGSGGDTGGDAP